MVRQARSEATRRKIIDSAVELINEIGYPASGLADIIERAELTKGALYYHFDSKEAVATAIIEEGASRVLDPFRSAGGPGSPAMESIVNGMFLVADVITNDAEVAGNRANMRLSVLHLPISGRSFYEQVMAAGDDHDATLALVNEIVADITS